MRGAAVTSQLNLLDGSLRYWQCIAADAKGAVSAWPQSAGFNSSGSCSRRSMLLS